MFLDHTQLRSTVGRTVLRRYIYIYIYIYDISSLRVNLEVLKLSGYVAYSMTLQRKPL